MVLSDNCWWWRTETSRVLLLYDKKQTNRQVSVQFSSVHITPSLLHIHTQSTQQKNHQNQKKKTTQNQKPKQNNPNSPGVLPLIIIIISSASDVVSGSSRGRELMYFERYARPWVFECSSCLGVGDVTRLTERDLVI